MSQPTRDGPFMRSGKIRGCNGPEYVVVGPGLPNHGYHFPEKWPCADALADYFMAIVAKVYRAARQDDAHLAQAYPL